MFKLLANENMKIYPRLRTYILVGVLALAVILIAWIQADVQKPNPNWKQTLTTQNTQISQELKQTKAKLPARTRVQLQQKETLNDYYISHNTDPNRQTLWTFNQAIVTNVPPLLLAFILVVAGDIVASEFSAGTIKFLLTQTKRRYIVLLAKYLATLFFGLVMTCAFFVISTAVGALFFGAHGAGLPHFYNTPSGSVAQMSTLSYVFMQYGFLLIQIVIVSTIAFMISTIFRNSAVAITLSILAYLLGNSICRVLAEYGFQWTKYILFSNMDFSQYVVGGPLVNGMTAWFSVGMVVAYFLVMNVLTWWIFMKRDVALT